MLRSPTPRRNKIKSAADHERLEHIRSFLMNNPIGVLTTVDPNGNPHATVIYFETEEDM